MFDGVAHRYDFLNHALSAGIAGLIYATVRIFNKKDSDPAAQASGAKAKLGLKGVLKELGTSLKDGVRMIFKDRFLRVYIYGAQR